MHDIPNSLERHTIVLRNTALSAAFGMHLSDLSYIIFCQLCLPLAFAHWAAMAFLFHLIGHVRLRIAKKDVKRIATKSDIASVADISAGGDRTFEQTPGRTMRPVVVFRPHVEFSVSPIGIRRSHPDPATRFRNHFDISHEALKNVHKSLLISESYYITDMECA